MFNSESNGRSGDALYEQDFYRATADNTQQLHALQQEYLNTATTKSPQTAEFQWNRSAQALSTSDNFDGLAVQWGKEQLNAYTDRLTKGDLHHMRNQTNSPLERDMIDSLGRQFADKDSISMEDLNSRAHQIEDRHQAAKNVERLMESFDGTVENSFLYKVDRTNKVDGKVGINDIEDYIKAKTFDKEHHVFDNMQPAMRDQELRDLSLAKWMQSNWDTAPEIIQLRGTHTERDDEFGGVKSVPNQYITLDNMAKAGGYINTFDMVKHTLHPHSTPENTPDGSAKPETQGSAQVRPASEKTAGHAQPTTLEMVRNERASERAVEHSARENNVHVVQKGETWTKIAIEALKNDPSCTMTVAQKVNELRHLNSYDFKTGLYKNGTRGHLANQDVILPGQRVTLYTESELNNLIEARIKLSQ